MLTVTPRGRRYRSSNLVTPSNATFSQMMLMSGASAACSQQLVLCCDAENTNRKSTGEEETAGTCTVPHVSPHTMLPASLLCAWNAAKIEQWCNLHLGQHFQHDRYQASRANCPVMYPRRQYQQQRQRYGGVLTSRRTLILSWTIISMESMRSMSLKLFI